MTDLDQLAHRIGEFCRVHGWNKEWSRGGCYLHLESSEFIEALRGKGDPIEEAGDVIIAFLSLVDHYDLPLDEILSRMETKMAGMENKLLEDTMPTFEALDTFNISGRGTVKVVNHPFDQPLPTVGSNILVDGKVYSLRGIETHAVAGRTNPIGLLVKERI